MGVTQSVLNKLFPGNTGISVPFGTPENVGSYHGTEQGVDIAEPAGNPVHLVAPSTYLGSTAGGYVALFRNKITGLVDYYQHIVTDTTLKPGADYSFGTVIGAIAPGGNVDINGAQYGSNGPHLEFGLASSGTPVGAGYPAYANVDPTNELNTSAIGDTGTSTPILGGLGNLFGQAGNTIGSTLGSAGNAVGNVGTDLNNLNNISYNNALGFLGLPNTSSIGSFLRKWGLIVLLSIGVLLLVIELFKGQQ